MPERALIGALKRTRVSTDDSPSASSPSARPSESKQSKRSVTFGEKRTLGTADAAIDRTPHGEPPRCGGCGLHCLGRLYACKTCERRVSMESLEVGPAFHERVSRAFNLCTVCFAAHVRVAYRDAIDDASAAGESSPGRTLRDEPASPATASARGDAADIIRAARELAHDE